MKFLKEIALGFFLFCTVSTAVSQNLYTNEPDLVYPILEEFIAENFKNEVHSFERINQIDSIVVADLGYDVSEDFIRKIYGLRLRTNNVHTIKVDSVLLQDKKRFERTLKHELGHVFDLPHLPEEFFLELMSREHWLKVKPHYADPEVWKRINSNYYQSIRKLQE